LCPTPPSNINNFQLQTLIAQGIEDHFDKVEEISLFAAGEKGILDTINNIKEVWD
jgi:hypothetical protein